MAVVAALTVPRSRAWGDALLVLVLVAAAVVLGYGLTAVASMFGPVAPALVIGLPLAPALLLAVFADARVAAVAAFATVPIGTNSVPGMPVELIMVVTGAFVVLVGLRRLAANITPLAWAPGLWWVLALLVWTVMGFPGAVDGSRAVRQIAQLGCALLFATLLLAACRTRRDLRVVVGGFLAVAFVVSVFALVGGQEVQAAHGGSVVLGRAQGPFEQPNELGSFAAPMALLAIAVAVTARTPRVIAGASAAGLALVAALALSFSRGAWIGFALGLGLLLFVLADARRVLGLLTPVLLLIAVSLGVFAPSNPQVQVIGARIQSITGERNPYDSRPAIWREARREMTARPLLGYGGGGFPVASMASTSESRTTYASHAHNVLLTWGAEAGVPAIAFIVGLSVHLAVAASRARRAATRAGRRVDAGIVAGLSAALVAVMGQGIVDYTLRNSAIMATVFALVGLLLAAARVGRHEEP